MGSKFLRKTCWLVLVSLFCGNLHYSAYSHDSTSHSVNEEKPAPPILEVCETKAELPEIEFLTWSSLPIEIQLTLERVLAMRQRLMHTKQWALDTQDERSRILVELKKQPTLSLNEIDFKPLIRELDSLIAESNELLHTLPTVEALTKIQLKFLSYEETLLLNFAKLRWNHKSLAKFLVDYSQSGSRLSAAFLIVQSVIMGLLTFSGTGVVVANALMSIPYDLQREIFMNVDHRHSLLFTVLIIWLPLYYWLHGKLSDLFLKYKRPGLANISSPMAALIEYSESLQSYCTSRNEWTAFQARLRVLQTGKLDPQVNELLVQVLTTMKTLDYSYCSPEYEYFSIQPLHDLKTQVQSDLK